MNMELDCRYSVCEANVFWVELDVRNLFKPTSRVARVSDMLTAHCGMFAGVRDYQRQGSNFIYTRVCVYITFLDILYFLSTANSFIYIV
jgi:hypothetical protein